MKARRLVHKILIDTYKLVRLYCIFQRNIEVISMVYLHYIKKQLKWSLKDKP